MARAALILLPVALAVGALCINVSSPSYGFDFHGGMWRAAHLIRAGGSPYPPADARVLLRDLNAFIPPPLLALIALPFSFLSWSAAIVAWNLVCAGAFVLALRLVGVRDWRLVALAVCSLPVVFSIGFGQPEGLLALGVAAAWRWRGSARGAVAVGAIVAAKLIVGPLVLWLLATRRWRAAAIASGSAIALLAVSWAAIGFQGLSAYPRLLAADARAFETRTHSTIALFIRAGISAHTAQILAVFAAALIAAAVVHRSGRSDQGLFIAAMAFSLLASPLLELHYLTLAIITLAIARPRLDGLWLLAINVFWLSPRDETHSAWLIALVLAATALILIRAAEPSRGFRIRDRAAATSEPTSEPTAVTPIAASTLGG